MYVCNGVVSRDDVVCHEIALKGRENLLNSSGFIMMAPFFPISYCCTRTHTAMALIRIFTSKNA